MKHPNAIKAICGEAPIPNHRTNSGIRANSGTGLTKLNIGSNILRKTLLYAKIKLNSIPNNEPITKPEIIINKLVPIALSKSPFICIKESNKSSGPGTNKGGTNKLNKYQI